VSLARRAGKPVIVANLEGGANAAEIRAFLLEHRIRVLNVAGPRESEAPGIHDQAAALLREVLSGNDPEPLPGPG